MANSRFKFRAWNKAENMYHYNAECAYDSMGGTPPLMHDSFGGVLCNDDYVVEQCTGLTDKNGKLIFEGDILRLSLDDGNKVDREIYYDRGCCQYFLRHLDKRMFDGYTFNSSVANSLEIIGNVHEKEVCQ